MKIQIEATTKETKSTSKGSVYTGIKIEGDGWVNIYGDHRGKRGQTLNITEPKSYAGSGETKWANIEKVSGPDPDPDSGYRSPPPGDKPPPPPTPAPPSGGSEASKRGFERTLQQYLTTMDIVHLHVKKLEPDSSEARAALINNFMSLWTEGKIIYG